MARMHLAASVAALIAGGSLAAAPAKPVTVVVLAPPADGKLTQPDPATVGEAMRYLDAADFEASVTRTSELVVGATLAAMVDNLHKRFGDQVPAELIDQLKTAIHDHAMKSMRDSMVETKRQTAIVYASEFTRAELVRLRELETDPVAVKARAKAKDIQPKLMMIGIKAARATQPEMEAAIQRVVSRYVEAHSGTMNGKS